MVSSYRAFGRERKASCDGGTVDEFVRSSPVLGWLGSDSVSPDVEVHDYVPDAMGSTVQLGLVPRSFYVQCSLVDLGYQIRMFLPRQHLVGPCDQLSLEHEFGSRLNRYAPVR